MKDPKDHAPSHLDLEIAQIDAFTDRVFGGNPAAVVHLSQWPSDATLQAIAAERRDNKVFLRADGSIPYERVVQVMGALNAGGFSNIGLVTDSGGPAFGGRRAAN